MRLTRTPPVGIASMSTRHSFSTFRPAPTMSTISGSTSSPTRRAARSRRCSFPARRHLTRRCGSARRSTQRPMAIRRCSKAGASHWLRRQTCTPGFSRPPREAASSPWTPTTPIRATAAQRTTMQMVSPHLPGRGKRLTASVTPVLAGPTRSRSMSALMTVASLPQPAETRRMTLAGTAFTRSPAAGRST